jgi:hypothetical protein
MDADTEEKGVKETIKERLLEATDADTLRSIRLDLKAEGFSPGSIDACCSELRKKGFLKYEKTTALTKALPVENLIAELRLPEIVNGQREVFDAGVNYAMKNIVIAVRICQELSAMGIAQSKPLLGMAQELRQSDSQAATAAAQMASERVLAHVMPQLEELRVATKSVPKATTPPPKDMDEVFVRPLGKIMQAMTDQMIGRMFPGFNSGQNQGWEFETRQETPTSTDSGTNE